MSLLHGLTGVAVLDGVLYAVGGHDGPLVRRSVEMYNPEKNEWTPLADMHTCRRNAGRIYIYVINLYLYPVSAMYSFNCVQRRIHDFPKNEPKFCDLFGDFKFLSPHLISIYISGHQKLSTK